MTYNVTKVTENTFNVTNDDGIDNSLISITKGDSSYQLSILSYDGKLSNINTSKILMDTNSVSDFMKHMDLYLL